MSERSSEKLTLETEMNMLKKEEARFRYLVTSNKTSPEYRKEALASLEVLAQKSSNCRAKWQH
jgi:hypothetical protein